MPCEEMIIKKRRTSLRHSLANREKHSGKSPSRKPPIFSEKTSVCHRGDLENHGKCPYKRFGKSPRRAKNAGKTASFRHGRIEETEKSTNRIFNDVKTQIVAS
jgi:hypothetical protein